MSDPAPPAAARRWRRWVVVGLAAVLALIGAADGYVVWATRGRLAGIDDAPALPYAIVLGNRVFPGGRPSIELALRLEAGRELYQRHRAGRLIVSGMSQPARGYDEPGDMAAWLEARGVPAADIILDRGGYRTAASMADAAAIGVRSLLVVSQAYHLPRAVYLAQGAGIQAVGVQARNARRHLLDVLHMAVREALARTETVVEVLVRGVRGAGPIPVVR